MFLKSRTQFHSRLGLPRSEALRGFTLVELLVVIVIIGILATLATVALTSSRSSARDARRISDLKQISSALELYYADNNGYPTIITPGNALTNPDQSKTYMAKIPTNPTPRAEGPCADLEYKYSGNTSDYSLIGCLAKATGDASAGARIVSIGGTARDLGPTAGIVGWWLMDSNYLTSDNKVGDISGNNNHGTVTSATLTTDQLGRTNKAYNFSNSTDKISLGDYNWSSIYGASGQLSFSLWYKADEIGDGVTPYHRYILNKYSASTNGREVYFLPHWTSNRYYVAFFGNSGGSITANASASTAAQVGVWHHLTVVYDNTNAIASKIKIYVNGLKDSGNSSASTGFEVLNSATALNIGNASSQPAKASISDFRIYNRALSQPEVEAIFNATKPTP